MQEPESGRRPRKRGRALLAGLLVFQTVWLGWGVATILHRAHDASTASSDPRRWRFWTPDVADLRALLDEASAVLPPGAVIRVDEGRAPADPAEILLSPGGGAPLRWDPAWGEFSRGEVVMTGVAIATALTALVIGPDEIAPWRPRFGVDEGARDVLRLDGEGERRFARELSDVLLTSLTSYPFVVDALVVAPVFM